MFIIFILLIGKEIMFIMFFDCRLVNYYLVLFLIFLLWFLCFVCVLCFLCFLLCFLCFLCFLSFFLLLVFNLLFVFVLLFCFIFYFFFRIESLFLIVLGVLLFSIFCSLVFESLCFVNSLIYIFLFVV